MPRALDSLIEPEIERSPALSLMAHPGDGSIKGRKIAILVADAIVGASVLEVHAALFAAGAVPRFVGPRIGPVATDDGVAIDADASLENEPGFLFDALVLPDGPGVGALGSDGRAMDFIKDQHRHCKAIFALGTSADLLDTVGVSSFLPSGEEDPGLVVVESASEGIDAFVAAVARHRHSERETDPPRV